MTDTGVKAPMHKNWSTTLPRINNFYTSTRFQERNLLGRLYPNTDPVSISYWALPGGEGAWQNYTFDDIKTQTFTPVELGGSYGPTWTTHWFKIDYRIPASWTGKEVRFRWLSGTEATIWSDSGVVLQGLSTGTDTQLRTDYVLTHSFDGDSVSQVMYVEMAANLICGAGVGDLIDPPDPDRYFTLTKAELAVLDRNVYNLMHDLDVLYQIANTLGKDNPRGHMALHSGNQMVNSILEGKDAEAAAVAEEFFSKGNGARAHTLAAIGNCHIDSAWLWPYSETKRKVARSYSSQLKLMDDYPSYVFVASQAQQWAWCKEYYLELFNRILPKITSGQFLPVGSTWTEMDGNIPSGESFIRQFFFGQKFFKNECGFTCKEFWLPDTFGYNGQIPALMNHVGLRRFLTQKMSWSMVNKFPHHNFVWEGIDGSTVLAHFPPGDSYHMNVTVEEAKHTESNLEDKGRVSVSAFLFGYGDGGGGPTERMLERRRRLADVDGVPKMELTTPDALFTQLESEEDNLMKWVGELFLELHNGTYTSQAAMKQLCRYAEFRLRDAEFMLSSAVAGGGTGVGSLLTDSLATLETAWKKVLLNQFHDVLPGSGIGIIYPEAQTYYEEAIASADQVFSAAAANLFGSSSTSTTVLMNTLQWPRREVVEISSQRARAIKAEKGLQRTRATTYSMVDVQSFGYNQIDAVTPDVEVTVVESDGEVTMSNEFITAKISSTGQVLSLILNGQTRDPFTAGVSNGNVITIYDDEPLYWDAWDVMDYHLETEQPLNSDSGSENITPVSVVESGPLVARLSWSLAISESSTLTQEIELTAASPYLTFNTTVDWHESHKILKTNFDTNIFARNVTYEIQFGHVQRPNHVNTSWDSARYEVCGHKWADISEPDFGLTVLNDSKFGWEGRGSTLSLSLLKAPKAPDDTCDMRTHTFKYAVMPHSGTLEEAEVMRRGYEFNNPLRMVDIPSTEVTANPTWSQFDVQGSGVVLHTIKAADDGSRDLVLRFFESNGCRSSATVTLQFVCTAVKETNGMEVTDGDAYPFTPNATNQTTTFDVSLKPFNIFALRLTL